MLDVIAWGGDPRTLEWFERPRDEALDAALDSARATRTHRLRNRASRQSASIRNPQSAVRNTARLTELGEQVRRLPLHPRLARMLVAAGGARQIAQACALLSERHLLPPRTATTTSDLLSALDDWSTMPPHVKRAADVIADFGLQIADSKSSIQSEIRNQQSAMSSEAVVSPSDPGRLSRPRGAAARTRFAERAAGIRHRCDDRAGERRPRRRVPRRPRRQSPQSAIRSPQSAIAQSAHPQSERSAIATVRIASRVEREWLEPTASEVVHRFDEESGKVRAFARRSLRRARARRASGARRSRNRRARSSPTRGSIAARATTDARLLRRLRFAGQDVDLAGTPPHARRTASRSLDEMRLDARAAAGRRCARSIATRRSRSRCRAAVTSRSSTTTTARCRRR